MKKSASQSSFDNTQDNQALQDRTIIELALKPENNSESAQSDCSIREAVERNLQQYFEDLGGQQASQVYQLVINEVEPALLQCVLDYAKGNQSRAAEILGLNRGTLRKKLKQHHIE